MALVDTAAAGPTSVTFYVSPQGNDAWSGRLTEPGKSDGPFATLERARDEIRAMRRSGELATRSVTVMLRGGNYERETPFTLSREDSGVLGAPVIYTACEGEEVRVVGGRMVTDWKSVTDPSVLSRLPEVARGQVLQTDLRGQGITDFGDFSDPTTMRRANTFTGGGVQLIFQDRLMPLSRWPREGWMHIVELVDGQPFEEDANFRDVGKFIYEGDRPSRWIGEKDAWAHGYWAYDFHDGRQRIESIDTARRVISLAPPNHHWGYRNGQWFYVFNLLSEMNSPGDWCLDREDGILYFWPPAPMDGGEAIVTLLQAPLVTLEDCSYMIIRGLTLEAARGTGVKVTGGTHNRIVGCTLRNIGGNAVIIEDGAANGVVDCEISGTGNGGISLSGGDRKTLTPAGHYAENNHIHHYSTWNRICTPAINLGGVGNRASHNLVHDAPHQAIAFGGNDHIIEFNHIYNVCTESNDAGAIYNGRDWTQRGTEIRYNFLHDIRGLNGRGANGVYLDDMLSGIEVRGNIFYRVSRALLLGGGRDNVIENNVFVECERSLHLDARCLGWGSEMLPTMHERLTAMPSQEPPWSTRYPALVNILSDEPEAPKGNVIARNVFWGGAMLSEHAKTVIKWFTVEANLWDQDPRFVDPDHLNFQLQNDSPAWAMGFERIPTEEIGLRKAPKVNCDDPAAENEVPIVNASLSFMGALLTETFDGPELDANLWLRPGWLVENHPNIGVKIENGHLVIWGTSSGSGSHQYAGIMSKNFRDTDVVLAADMQVQSPFNGEGRIQHMVHLCNATPDFFSEIIFGKIAGNDPPCWHTAYLARIWEYSGHGEYLQPILPPTGTEATQWHTVVLVHDGATSKSQNYLVVNGQWVPIGPASLIRYNHTLVVDPTWCRESARLPARRIPQTTARGRSP